jgi:hypothetical protein
VTPLHFFVIGGAVLMISGVLQIFFRPPKAKENRWINGGTVKSVFFIVVGLTAVLLGTGVIPLAGLGMPVSR